MLPSLEQICKYCIYLTLCCRVHFILFHCLSWMRKSIVKAVVQLSYTIITAVEEKVHFFKSYKNWKAFVLLLTLKGHVKGFNNYCFPLVLKMRLTVVPAFLFLFSLLDRLRSLYLGRARQFCKQFVYTEQTVYAPPSLLWAFGCDWTFRPYIALLVNCFQRDPLLCIFPEIFSLQSIALLELLLWFPVSILSVSSSFLLFKLCIQKIPTTFLQPLLAPSITTSFRRIFTSCGKDVLNMDEELSVCTVVGWIL